MVVVSEKEKKEEGEELETQAKAGISTEKRILDISSDDSTSLNYSQMNTTSHFYAYTNQSAGMPYSLPMPVLVPVPIITPYLTTNYQNAIMNSSKCCLVTGNHIHERELVSSNQLVLGVKLPFSALDSQIRAKPPPFVRIPESLPPPTSVYLHHHHHHYHYHPLQQQKKNLSSLSQSQQIDDSIRRHDSSSSISILSINETEIISNEFIDLKSTNLYMNSRNNHHYTNTLTINNNTGDSNSSMNKNHKIFPPSTSLSQQQSMKETLVTVESRIPLPNNSTTTSINNPTELLVMNEITNRNFKPRVAFIEPINEQLNNDNHSLCSILNDDTDSQLNRESIDETRQINNEKRRVNKLKLSLSARFPGWGVITDDDEDDDDDNVATNMNNTQCDQKLTLVEKPIEQTVSKNLESKKKDEDIQGEKKQEKKASSTDLNKNDTKNNSSPVLPLKSQSNTDQYTSSRMSNITDITTEQPYYQQHHHLHESQYQLPLQKSIEKHRSSSILTQPRKSLAMIFSQISNNLGFTPQSTASSPSPQYPDDQYVSQFTLNSHSIPRRKWSNHITIKRNNSQITENILNTEQLVDNYLKSPPSSYQHHKSFDESIRANDTSNQRLIERGILNTLMSGNHHRQSRNNSSIGTMSNIHLNKSGSQLNATLASGNNTMSTSVDRSIIVDLLCCTCCTNSDEEDEAYSNLIENHRLARIVTMGAILTILGLIFAYIIRSATEPQNMPGTTTSSTTGFLSSASTGSILNITDLDVGQQVSKLSRNLSNLTDPLEEVMSTDVLEHFHRLTHVNSTANIDDSNNLVNL
ncbi:unnamed protein product [Heterobilharzia americana]|nr:unnamed protein product [Heterobilharzia americana]